MASDDRSSPDLPPVRQEVVDVLADHLRRDDQAAFDAAAADFDATRAEVAAATAGLIESRSLDLPALEHTLEILEEVAQLPGPDDEPPA